MEKIYDSNDEDVDALVSYLEDSVDFQILCVFYKGTIITMCRYITQLHSYFHNRDGRVIAKRNGHDLYVNDCLIKKTTVFGRAVLLSWYEGVYGQQDNVLSSFSITSPLLDSLY